MVNIVAEQQVIRYLWGHLNNFADLFERVRSEFFSDTTCLVIWQAVSQSFVNNSETNEITVRQYLSPAIDLSWLDGNPPAKPGVYIDIVRSNYLRREFAAVVERGAERIKDPQVSPEFIVSDTGARILDLTMLDAEKKPTDFKSVMHRGLAFIKANHAAAQSGTRCDSPQGRQNCLLNSIAGHTWDTAVKYRRVSAMLVQTSLCVLTSSRNQIVVVRF